ncbi:MAG: hypothetical protein M3Q09_12680, partial [Gemmatimonadota bacterium]|nr:hypothetical protein [Gemmatimonadota bacterium]
DEYRGAGGQNQVSVSVNVWGFANTVSEVHVHQRSGAGSGRLLLGTSSGYLVRDSVWNGVRYANVLVQLRGAASLRMGWDSRFP